MKIIISESQLKMLIEDEKKESLLPIKGNEFIKKYKKMLKPTFSKRYGTEVPNYKLKGANGIKINGDLDLSELDVEDIERILDEVVYITGNLDLFNFTKISSLNRLEKVGGKLELFGTSIKS